MNHLPTLGDTLREALADARRIHRGLVREALEKHRLAAARGKRASTVGLDRKIARALAEVYRLEREVRRASRLVEGPGEGQQSPWGGWTGRRLGSSGLS